MKLNQKDLWILYRLINNHLNGISELSTELDIRKTNKYIERLEAVEIKIQDLLNQ